MSTKAIANAMKREKSPEKRDLKGFTDKQRREKLYGALHTFGFSNALGIEAVLYFLKIGAIVADCKRKIVSEFFDGTTPATDDDFDYADLLMAEVSKREGGIRPMQRPVLEATIPLAEHDWGGINAKLMACEFDSDVRAALILAIDGTSVALSNILTAIWGFVHSMPRKTITRQKVDPKTGAVVRDEKTGEAVQETIQRFGVLKGTANAPLVDVKKVETWRTLKREIRDRQALAVRGEATITAEWFCERLGFHFEQFYEPRVNKLSGKIRFVEATETENSEMSAIEKMRHQARVLGGTLGLSGVIGVWYVDGITSAKIPAAIEMAEKLGFVATAIGADDNGIPGQVRISEPPPPVKAESDGADATPDPDPTENAQ